MNGSCGRTSNCMANANGLENSCSSQETQEVEGDQKISTKGEKGCVGAEEVISQDSPKGGIKGASGTIEGSVPKINTSKGERERGREKNNELTPIHALSKCMMISFTPFLTVVCTLPPTHLPTPL